MMEDTVIGSSFVSNASQKGGETIQLNVFNGLHITEVVCIDGMGQRSARVCFDCGPKHTPFYSVATPQS